MGHNAVAAAPIPQSRTSTLTSAQPSVLIFQTLPVSLDGSAKCDGLSRHRHGRLEVAMVSPDEEPDRTRDPDREQELRKREHRNRKTEKQLERGQTCAYRSSGRSLELEIKNNDLCMYTPVTTHHWVEETPAYTC